MVGRFLCCLNLLVCLLVIEEVIYEVLEFFFAAFETVFAENGITSGLERCGHNGIPVLAHDIIASKFNIMLNIYLELIGGANKATNFRKADKVAVVNTQTNFIDKLCTFRLFHRPVIVQ